MLQVAREQFSEEEDDEYDLNKGNDTSEFNNIGNLLLEDTNDENADEDDDEYSTFKSKLEKKQIGQQKTESKEDK